MRKRKWVLALVISLVGISWLTPKVWAVLQLPQITTACELKTGGLYSVGDGFSLLNKCPPNAGRMVTLGQSATGGGSASMKVYDKNNTLMGTLVSLPTQADGVVFYHQPLGVIIKTASGLPELMPIGEQMLRVGFASSDCSGTAYVMGDDSEAIVEDASFLMTVGRDYYYTLQMGVKAQAVTFQSNLIWDQNSNLASCQATDDTVSKYGTVLINVPTASLGFQVPLAVPVHYKYE